MNNQISYIIFRLAILANVAFSEYLLICTEMNHPAYAQLYLLISMLVYVFGSTWFEYTHKQNRNNQH